MTAEIKTRQRPRRRAPFWTRWVRLDAPAATVAAISHQKPQLANLVEAHQRGPRPIGAPAIVRHLGVWPRAIDSDGRDGFTTACIRTAESLQAVLKSADPRFEPDRIGPFMPFEFIYGGAIATVVLARGYDYATATFILDLSKKPDAGRSFVIDNPGAHAEVKKLEDAFRRLETELSAGKTTELERIQEVMFESFWAGFAKNLALDLPITADHPACEVFADFRGLLLVAGHEGRIRQLGAETSSFSLEETARFDPIANKAAFKRLGPLVRAAHPFARDIEFVVCNVMRRAALYISALGNVGGQVARPNEPKFQDRHPAPLKYIVAVNGLHETAALPFRRWPLGRLVFKLNELGTLRLLAVREAHAIKVVGEKAFELGRQLDELFRKQTEKDEKEVVRSELPKFFKALNEIGEKIHAGGFSYRISRSRFFAQQFRRLLGNLHVKRIPAGLPYDQFVSGRVFGDFDEIDRIGVRIEALYNRANTLLSLVNTESLLANQEQQVQDLRIQSTTLEKIQRLQRSAELLVIFGGAYYVGSMSKYIIPFLASEGMLGRTGWFTPIQIGMMRRAGDEPNHGIVAVVFIVALCFFLTLTRFIGPWLATLFDRWRADP